MIFTIIFKREHRNYDSRIISDGASSLPGTIILRMAYGYRTNDFGPDPLVELADDVMTTIVSKACNMGYWLVDILPFSTSPFRIFHAQRFNIIPVAQ